MLFEIPEDGFSFGSDTCLNPYSNGICSLRVKGLKIKNVTVSLNPYSNGICSLRVKIFSLIFQ